MPFVVVTLPGGGGDQRINVATVLSLRNTTPVEKEHDPDAEGVVRVGSGLILTIERLQSLHPRFAVYLKLAPVTLPNGRRSWVSMERVVDVDPPLAVDAPGAKARLYFSAGPRAPFLAVTETPAELRQLWVDADVDPAPFD